MSNNYERKEELKALLPTYLTLLEEEGITEERENGFWDCPFCASGRGERQTPAFHIVEWGDGFRYKCFSCGESGDIFDLVKYMEDMEDANFPQVYARTEKIMKVFLEEQQSLVDDKIEKVKVQDIKHPDFSNYLTECHSQIKLTSYFCNRGLSDHTIDRFQLGFDPKKFVVTIPYNAGHEGTGYIHRTFWGIGNRYIKHGNELFNIDAIQKNDRKYVFVTEGQIDAMSFEEIGYPAIGLGGVNEIDKLIDLLIENNTCKCLILALDNDVAGRRSMGKIIETVAKEELRFPFLALSWIYGNYKDANEFLVKDRDGFEKQIRRVISVLE